ncbi:hypothetical protein HanHA89_Chr12g0463161 [Helianthus annuus]|nr:hypothetical protein HanHA89_Chr12g0463161 [Helianthus annuus]
MIQVWGCLATSPLRYQRIQEIFMFLSDYYSCIITNTTDLQIRSCLFLIVCTFVYIHVFVHGWADGWCFDVFSLWVVKDWWCFK